MEVRKEPVFGGWMRGRNVCVFKKQTNDCHVLSSVIPCRNRDLKPVGRSVPCQSKPADSSEMG